MQRAHVTDDAKDRFAELTDRVEHAAGDLAGRTSEQLDSAVRQLQDMRDRAADTFDVSPRPVRPSWTSRLGWLGLGAAIGALATWFADPERGRGRRRELADRASAVGRRATDEVAGEMSRATGVAEGAVRETMRTVTPQDTPDDPKLLRQRIRSEVFGHRDDVRDVIIRIDEPGHVALKGTMPDGQAAASLVEEVRAVDGVRDVQSELATA